MEQPWSKLKIHGTNFDGSVFWNGPDNWRIGLRPLGVGRDLQKVCPESFFVDVGCLRFGSELLNHHELQKTSDVQRLDRFVCISYHSA